ncbi:MAG: Na+/H+ antiporter subunit C [Phycisphaeraceae bacterium]|nr:Na+/H+ antiporter subunit C [Phycisphaeraceae bacterium]MBX3368161.1 Na+/H+ antiporter subunit C [Phycisphaeraceae bacterium]QYK47834.1 MAG: Na+/H+ antiporter subunit C [Phycisphaeraceae bacterium]
MQILIAIIIGGIFACAIYMILRRSIVKLIMGLALLGHAANLLIFSAGGLAKGHPALVAPGSTAPPEPYADPLPQALILTAIVISFGVLAFMMVLVSRAYNAVGNDDTDEFVNTER